MKVVYKYARKAGAKQDGDSEIAPDGGVRVGRNRFKHVVFLFSTLNGKTGVAMCPRQSVADARCFFIKIRVRSINYIRNHFSSILIEFVLAFCSNGTLVAVSKHISLPCSQGGFTVKNKSKVLKGAYL